MRMGVKKSAGLDRILRKGYTWDRLKIEMSQSVKENSRKRLYYERVGDGASPMVIGFQTRSGGCGSKKVLHLWGTSRIRRAAPAEKIAQ